MATALPTESTTIDCAICLENFKDPRLLPCGHVLCHKCVKAWILKKENATCPQCVYPIIDEENLLDQSLEIAADDLPRDLSMVALVKADKVLNQEHVCVGCDVSATCMCVDCGDTFCNSCRIVHNKQTVTKHHKVEHLSTLTPDKVYGVNHPTMCPFHADKPLSYFCHTHNQTVCKACVRKDHEACVDVQDLDAVVGETHKLLTDLIATMKEGEEKRVFAVKILDRRLQQMELNVFNMHKNIDDACDRLDDAVKDCRYKLKSLTGRAFEDIKAAIDDAKKYMMDGKGLLVSHGQLGQRSLGLLKHDECKTMYSELKTRINRLNCKATPPIEALSNLKLEIDYKAVSNFEKALAKLGEVGQVKILIPKSPSVEHSHWCFTNNQDGATEVFSDNQRTVHRSSSGGWSGILMSQQPMQLNMVYEVLVKRAEFDLKSKNTGVGVTSHSLHCDTRLSFNDLVKPCVMAWHHSVNVNKRWKFTKQYRALQMVQEGSRFGVMLDSIYQVHVFMDEKDLGVVTPDANITWPAYAVFDFQHNLHTVTALPPRKI